VVDADFERLLELLGAFVDGTPSAAVRSGSAG
jgi:hypothetical protein